MSIRVEAFKPPRPPRGLRDAAIAVAGDALADGIGRGIPEYDQAKDQRTKALDSFADFARRLAKVRRLLPLYGTSGDRFALAWVYGQSRFESPSDAWRTFWAEMTNPRWTYFAFADIHNFSADGPVDFEDGLFVRPRGRRALLALTAWDVEQVEPLFGWSPEFAWGRSQHLLMAIEQVPKTPDNLVAANTGTESVRVHRLLLALRLAAEGDIRVGRLYFGRREHFSLLGGTSSSLSFTPPGLGTEYQLEPTTVPRVGELYDRLQVFDSKDAARLGHISLALTRFTATFERPWTGAADRLVDDIVALEAIVGTRDELAFTIAFRVSGMLEIDDARRLNLFRVLKSFYSTRSDVLHGSRLKERAQADLANEEELRGVVREVLRGLLLLVGKEFDPSAAFMRDRLDEVLLVAGDRHRLVSMMKS